MSEHTKGRLTLFISGNTVEIQDDEQDARRPIVHWMGFDPSDRPINERKANARRLVACWNALEGLDTDFIYRVAALRELMGCPDLNIDGLEPESHDAKREARAILAKHGGAK